MNAWQRNLAAWQAYAETIRARAEAVQRARNERAWQLAASVGIGRCGCSLHNASIDDSMTGWCKDRPDRLRAAKRAVYMMDSCNAGRLADRLISRMYDRLLRPATEEKI